jgi:hypothetical protein
MRRWVGCTLYKLRDTVSKDWQWVLDEIKALLADLPSAGSRRLFELWKQIPERHALHRKSRSALTQLHELLISLSEYWPHYWVSDFQKEMPRANSLTGQAIGRMMIRCRTVRGYKSRPRMWAAVMLSCARVIW